MIIYQVDAFADKLFRGNPAAVCILEDWLSDEVMQQIGMENNLAETAFIVNRGKYYDIRWFTPSVEVELCGHATLASAFVLFELENHNKEMIYFHTKERGELRVYKQDRHFFLDFPKDIINPVDVREEIAESTGIRPDETYKGLTDFIAVFRREEDIIKMVPDFNKIAGLDARGMVVTARGIEVDFVSRFFAPQSGIDEDPVTGSAHTSLIPLWSEKLAKKEMKARQLSKRGGELICVDNGDRCLIGGTAVLYLKGEIYL